MVYLDARFLSIAFLLVFSRASSTPLPESKNSDDPASTTNEKQDEPFLFLVDDGLSEFFVLDPISTDHNKESMSDAAESSPDVKDKQGSERFLLKKFFYSRPRPVAVLPVAVLQPQVPQVVRVPSSFKVIVGAEKPHVYVLRPPHYRPVLVSTGLGAAGLAGGFQSLGVAGLGGGLQSLGVAGLGGGLQSLGSSASLLPGSAAALQQQLLESSLTTGLPQVAQPVGLSPRPQPSASLLSGILTNLMSLGTKVPTIPAQPVPSLIPRPTVSPSTTIDFQVQKVIDVMAHSKEDQPSKEN